VPPSVSGGRLRPAGGLFAREAKRGWRVRCEEHGGWRWEASFSPANKERPLGAAARRGKNWGGLG
jgi:hypothetical protein